MRSSVPALSDVTRENRCLDTVAVVELRRKENAADMNRARWHHSQREGVKLACLDVPGGEPSVLFVHGLAGRASEWWRTASALKGSHRVLALDQRGHGSSERRPSDMSPEALVGDVAFWIDQLSPDPVILVGQSLGGLIAFLTAARHPRLVRGLVVAEASPTPDPEGAERVARWLAEWPIPFKSSAVALEFFGGNNRWARAWCDGLEPTPQGLMPAFDVDIMVATLKAPAGRSYWADWQLIGCPTLVVRGEGGLAADEADRMVEAVPGAEVAVITGAGHDAHLEQPEVWQMVLSSFLAGFAEH